MTIKQNNMSSRKRTSKMKKPLRSFHLDEEDGFRLARSSIWRDALLWRRLHRGTSVQREATARDADGRRPIISGLFTIDRWDISRDVSRSSKTVRNPNNKPPQMCRCSFRWHRSIDAATTLYVVENRVPPTEPRAVGTRTSARQLICRLVGLRLLVARSRSVSCFCDGMH